MQSSKAKVKKKKYLGIYHMGKHYSLKDWSQHTWVDVAAHISNTPFCRELSYSPKEISSDETESDYNRK